MSAWDTEVAVASDEDEARKTSKQLAAAGGSHVVSRRPHAAPKDAVSLQIRLRSHDLSTARPALWPAGGDRR